MNKWAPFQSLMRHDNLINELTKHKVANPRLSEEQINQLETIVKEAYAKQIHLNFILYQNGYATQISGKIKRIIPADQKLILDSQKIVFFTTIITITEMEE